VKTNYFFRSMLTNNNKQQQQTHQFINRTINGLRKDGALNLTLKPEEMTRPITDRYRLELSMTNRMYQWLIYGFLCTPGTFALPGAVDFTKFVISEGFMMPIFRDISIPLYPGMTLISFLLFSLFLPRGWEVFFFPFFFSFPPPPPPPFFFVVCSCVFTDDKRRV
jgi:hypothetical protein